MLLKMKIINIIVSLIFCITVINGQTKPATVQKNRRIEKVINSNWTFNYFPSENADNGYQAPSFNDSRWPAVSIPHTWSTYETTGELHPFILNPNESDSPYWWLGWGWYRKHFTINADYSDRKVFIEFEGVQKYCKVWLNGQYLGDHKGGHGSFDFDITSLIKQGGDNVLAVAVNNRQKDKFNIPPMAAGNFNFYGGIYRDVTIVLKDKLYIPMQGSAAHEGGTFVTTPKVSDKEALVRVQTWVKNEYPQKKSCTLKTTIYDASGRIVQVFQSTADIEPLNLHRFDQTSATIKIPHLWSPSDPYMYKVLSEVSVAAQVTDTYTSPLGIRFFKWDYKENILYVNGKKTVLQGGNRHQEYPWLGAAIPKWITMRDFADIDAILNYNFIQTSNYPNDKLVYDQADKYGIIVNEESLSIKNQKFSPEVQLQQTKEMIRRDRNHPGIMFWSFGNEPDSIVDSKSVLEEDTTRVVATGSVYVRSADESGTFKDILIEKGTMQVSGAKDGRTISSQTIVARAPAKVILRASHQKISADRGSILIITADITDDKGNHVPGASNSVRWTVTGPAKLVGPAYYQSEINKQQHIGGVWYVEMPVSNVVRSTGKPGKIRVTVSSAGLASGSVDLVAEAVIPDNAIITEPVLADEGRGTVDRATTSVSKLPPAPVELKPTVDELVFPVGSKTAYLKAVRDYMFKNNPSVDTATIEFRTLTAVFSIHLQNNGGRIIADDYNFNTDHYNSCRLITKFIPSTKLPELFKDCLKRYYAESIIKNGSEKSPVEEMNWLNWIPSGGTVVVAGDKKIATLPKGTITTDKTGLKEIISLVHAGFPSFSDEAKERALTFISKMNPYVKISEISETDSEGKKNTKVTYTAEKGEPILIPLLKFIAE
jgi:hypothetical protein